MSQTFARFVSGTRFALLLGCLAVQGARGQDAPDQPWTEGSATVVLLPDTQWYTKSHPEFFEAQTGWVLTNKAARNIACVVHLGDITESNAPGEWEIARRAFAAIDGVVPYLLVPGNHDYTGTNRQTLLNGRFPVELLRKQPTFGGSLGGESANTWHLVTIGGRRWLVLGLEFGPRDEAIAWASDVLAEHADCPALVATHAYLFRDGTRFDHTRGAQRGSPHDSGNDGEELWRKLIAPHPNVQLVVCGHVRSGGVAYLASRGEQGQLVHQMLSDYEAVRGSGAGYLRLLEFLPDGKTLRVKTYSPVLNRSMTDPANEFTLTLPSPPQTVMRLDRRRWTRVPVRTVADVKGAPAAPPALDRYGGLASSNATGGATGFFRTQRRDGRWTLVDPDGHPFLCIGLCSVNPEIFAPGAEVVKFGSRTNWAAQTAAMLRQLGFNTLGRWSESATFRALPEPLAYTTSLSFIAGYDKQRPARYGGHGIPVQTLPVFDPEFPAFADKLAESLAQTRDDPWLLGHFSDNELPFRPDALTLYLKLPESDPGRAAAERWLAEHKLNREKIQDADQLAFLEEVADHYYSTVRQAILKHDPNHLYLGSRLNGQNINAGTLRGSRAVDVVSINLYHCWSLDHGRFNRWAELAGRPILASEWYAMTLASEAVQTKGAGFRVKSQRDRGLFYQNLGLGMLGNPNCIGWHWFKYGGDDDESSRGFVDRDFEPHGEMTELMRQLNADAYALRDLLLP